MAPSGLALPKVYKFGLYQTRYVRFRTSAFDLEQRFGDAEVLIILLFQSQALFQV